MENRRGLAFYSTLFPVKINSVCLNWLMTSSEVKCPELWPLPEQNECLLEGPDDMAPSGVQTLALAWHSAALRITAAVFQVS